MKVSTKGRYALRFMIDLAEHEAEGPITLKDISNRQGISVKYLEHVATQLTRAGLIRSIRGNQGGYRLSREPSAYTADEILTVVEGRLCPVACLEQTPNQCERYAFCKTVRFWEGLEKAVSTYLRSYTLKDLMNSSMPENAGDYCI
ncbi:MAG: Rrf2 family transcriptional regulator [Clostridia bacterium]|nr:Rrf2 family transcriptional regulator [Clostridia bacterium]